MKKSLIGMLVLILALGMAVIGCDDDDNSVSWIPVTVAPFTTTFSGGNTVTLNGDEYTRVGSGDSLNGVWEYTEEEKGYFARATVFGSSNWIFAQKFDGKYYDIMKGTLTIDGQTVTFTQTHVNSEFVDEDE